MDESTAALALAIGVRVRQERQSRRWTLDQLAEAAGVSRRMVVNVEQGAANPSVGTLLRISDALGVGLPLLPDPDADRQGQGGGTLIHKCIILHSKCTSLPGLPARLAALGLGYGAHGQAAEALAAEITSAGGRTIAVGADLRRPQGPAELVQTAAEALGPVDVLVSNAGQSRVQPLEDITAAAQFDEMLAVNLRAPLLLAQAG